MRFIKPLTLLLLLTLFAAACSSDDPLTGPDQASNPSRGEDTIVVDGQDVQLVAALSGFDDCDVLLDHLHDKAAERVGPYGFNSHGWLHPRIAIDDFEAMDDGNVATSDEERSSVPSTAPVEGVDFSGTNVQEVGVDEADIIKTDGELIYVVAASELVVVDVDERVVVGTVDLPEQLWQAELFLDGDDLLLVASGWAEKSFDRNAPTPSATVGVPEPRIDRDPAYPFYCLLYTSPSPRDRTRSRMPSSA